MIIKIIVKICLIFNIFLIVKKVNEVVKVGLKVLIIDVFAVFVNLIVKLFNI